MIGLVLMLMLMLGAYFLVMAAVGMTTGLSPAAAIAICIVVPVAVLSGLGSWAHHLGAPRGWLVAAGGGAFLMAAPLLVRWVQGSWTASFAMPRRYGRMWWVRVEDYAWWSLAVGGALAVIGLIGYYASAKLRKRAAG